ncbi:MAG: glutaredoxin family protein [archaeon]
MKIIVYGTEQCPWCKRAKDFLSSRGINFTEKDVGADLKAAEEMVKKSGQTGVPVIDANGTIMVGFDEDRLKEILRIK